MSRSDIRVTVTQEHIDNGIRCSTGYCAASMAIYDAIPEASYVESDLREIRFSIRSHGKRYCYPTPPQVSEYIIAYDAGDPIPPFEFVLRERKRRIFKIQHMTPRIKQKLQQYTDKNKVGSSPKKPKSRQVNQDGTRVEQPKLSQLSKSRNRKYGARQLRHNQSPPPA